MTQYTISSNSRQKIIDFSEATAVREKDDDAQAIKIQVISGGTTRLVDHNGKDQARHAESLEIGDTLYMDPLGKEWYAYADGQQVTVETNVIRYRLVNVGGF